MISEDPSLSTRKAASALQCSQTFIVTVLHDDLHLKPFKFHNWHFIEEHDYAKRLEFAQCFLKLRKSTEQFMIFSDEAYFYLTLPNNKQNNLYWDVSANWYGIKVPLHDKKVLVWCAISSTHVFGPYFFGTTVNSTNYLEMLRTYFIPRVDKTQDYGKSWWSKSPHGYGGPNLPHPAIWDKIPWQNNVATSLSGPQSLWFFLWGYLKQRVYNPLPKTLEALQMNIEREVKNIPQTMLKDTFLNFRKRCELLISAGGGHIEWK